MAQVGLVAMVVACGFAAIAGDRWARLSAALHASNWIAVSLLQVRHRHDVFQTGDFVADVIGAALAIAIAGRSGRTWAALLAAFQLLGVANYISWAIDRRIIHRVFMTAAYVWESGALACLLWGGVDGYRRRAHALVRVRGIVGPPSPNER